MGTILKELTVGGNKGVKKIPALFDSGATVSLIRKDVVEDIATILTLSKVRTFKLGDGKNPLETNQLVALDITINGCDIFEKVLVVENLAKDLIIGAETMQYWKMKLDLEKEAVIIDPKATDFELI